MTMSSWENPFNRSENPFFSGISTPTAGVHPATAKGGPCNQTQLAFLDRIRAITGGAPDLPQLIPGRFVRFSTNDKPSDTSGWCRLFQDQVGGVFGCWRQNITDSWFEKTPQTDADRAELRRRVQLAREELKRDEEQRRARCREEAETLWCKAGNVMAEHDYVIKKRISPFGAKQLIDSILVPLRDVNGLLHGLQMIERSGFKKFMSGTSVTGHFNLIGEPAGRLLICEGWATGCTLHQITGDAVAVAFDAGNLPSVAEVLRGEYPDITIIVAADDDHTKEPNTGLVQATHAARKADGLVARPLFAGVRGGNDTDFNDLASANGCDAVKASLEAASAVETVSIAGADSSRPETVVRLTDDSDAVSVAPTTGAVGKRSLQRITDTQLKNHFSQTYGKIVRYVPGLGWHFWDGARWRTHARGGVFPLIDLMVKDLMRRAEGIADEKQRLDRKKALIALEAHQRQKTLVEACAHVPSLITEPEQLDKDFMLLNCRNGTLDLRVGTLKKHDPADFITRIVTVDYNASAECPVFMKFILWAMKGDAELVSYLQRFFGYCLTGKTTEQVLNFWHGSGGNGKSTLMTVIQWLLNDYATTADTSLIMKRDSGGGDGNRLAMLAGLRGARLVTLSEVNDGENLDEAAIKSFTGGDVITCRHLYQSFFAYTPQAKLIGFGNYKPHVRGTDNGIWRRIHLVPFQAVVSEENKDPALPEKLRAELPGILAWAVRGCLMWQGPSGLKPSAAMKDAVKSYRQGEDAFQSWLNECCIQGQAESCSAKDLLDSFKEFSGMRSMSQRKFGDLLTERGFEKMRSNGIKRLGLSLNMERLEQST